MSEENKASVPDPEFTEEDLKRIFWLAFKKDIRRNLGKIENALLAHPEGGKHRAQAALVRAVQWSDRLQELTEPLDDASAKTWAEVLLQDVPEREPPLDKSSKVRERW